MLEISESVLVGLVNGDVLSGWIEDIYHDELGDIFYIIYLEDSYLGLSNILVPVDSNSTEVTLDN